MEIAGLRTVSRCLGVFLTIRRTKGDEAKKLRSKEDAEIEMYIQLIV